VSAATDQLFQSLSMETASEASKPLLEKVETDRLRKSPAPSTLSKAYSASSMSALPEIAKRG
jgi:hypothetical protein